jgi:hypothetical protein
VLRDYSDIRAVMAHGGGIVTTGKHFCPESKERLGAPESKERLGASPGASSAVQPTIHFNTCFNMLPGVLNRGYYCKETH